VVLAATGAGIRVAELRRIRPPAGVALAVLVAVLPVVLLPSLAWGVGGRVTAVEVPHDLREAATVLSGAPPGTVGLLPWSQYRRYGWNGSRVSLTLVPRMVDQRVVFNDGLPLATGEVPGEDPVAGRVGERIARGVAPLDALAAEGVRWVVVEKETGLPDPAPPESVAAGARVVHDGPAVRVVELPTDAAGVETKPSAVTAWGWAVTSLTWLVALGCVLITTIRRRRYLLVQSAA
jgi:hypothetical protein